MSQTVTVTISIGPEASSVEGNDTGAEAVASFIVPPPPQLSGEAEADEIEDVEVPPPPEIDSEEAQAAEESEFVPPAPGTESTTGEEADYPPPDEFVAETESPGVNFDIDDTPLPPDA